MELLVLNPHSNFETSSPNRENDLLKLLASELFFFILAHSVYKM